MADLNINEATALVRDTYVPILSDMVFESSALLKMFKDKADRQGGRNIIKSPILYAKPTAHGAVKGWGDVDINPTKKWTAAEYAWATLYASLAISFDEIDDSADDHAIVKRIEKEIEVARKSLSDDLGLSLFNDGNDTDYPHGLGLIVSTDRTLGGINSTNFSWWDANVDSDTTNYTKANMTDPTSAYYVLKLLRSMWRSCKHNEDKPNVIVISGGWHDILEEELQPYTRYGSGDIRKASFDFADFDYRGQAPVVEDDFLTEHKPGNLFMLNFDWVDMTIHTNREFDVTPFQKPVNKQGYVSTISLRCQFTSRGPSRLGRIVAATAIDA